MLSFTCAAYDTTYSESELKCLTGSEGVAEVVETVVATRDYNLMERTLKVVEKKEKSKFDLRSCQKLLLMLIRSRSQHALSSSRILFVNKILSGLLPSLEPDDELYDMILSSIEKFGHDNLTSGISSMLNDTTRMKNHNLSFFLRRADFILTINRGLENKMEHRTSYLEKSISDLESLGANVVGNSDEINTKLLSMISDYGWEEMSSVVEATLSFMHRKIKASYSNKTATALLDRCFLIWKLHDHPCAFLQTCLEDFAKDFACSLSESGLGADKIQGEKQKIFVKAICYAMAHGAHSDMATIGGWAIVNQNTFSAVLEAIPAQSIELEFNTQDLLRDILNKCLVQQTANWYSHPLRENGTRDPSIHIQKILKDHPLLPHMVDEEGRTTLHYAAAATGTDPSPRLRASHETINHLIEANPEGVSRLDPVTGLYPFMLAAGNSPTTRLRSLQINNITASFSLLLANPNLVACGAQPDVADNSRKRKRDTEVDT